MACPMKSDNGYNDLKNNPKFFIAWYKAGLKWWYTHPNASSHRKFRNFDALVCHNLFYKTYQDFLISDNGMFGEADWTTFLSNKMNINIKEIAYGIQD